MNAPMQQVSRIDSPNDLSIYTLGPDLAQGALPSIFYFCVGGQQTLSEAPFNTFCTPLRDEKIRIFSFDLPGHGHGLDNQEGVPRWAHAIANGDDLITAFVDKALEIIDFLILQGWVDEQAIAVAGLSRGGFMATHIAAADERIKTVLGLAPMTRLTFQKAFKDLKEDPLTQSLDLEKHVVDLTKKHLRYYIGNRDLMVSTDACYSFIQSLTEESYKQGVRSAPVELIISPSIGHQGHGTATEIFQAGAQWVKERISAPQNRA
ncbi:MAG: alpha/beta hydrolase [Waddliaceae bacterium]|nr:alpha/beta hydrolase [Waddliaceae bacterium]